MRNTFWVCLLTLTASAARADVLVMKNGDRVTGNVIKKDGASITIKSASFGAITAPWDQVASLEAGAAGDLTVITKDGKAVRGPVTAPLGEIVTIRNPDEQRAWERLQSPGWRQLWAGAVNVGLAGAGGNAKTQTLTTGLAAARTTSTDKTFLSLNVIESSASVNHLTSKTAQAIRAGIGYDHRLSPRLFLNTFNNYEYDKFQNLDLRFTAGGGLGFHLIKSDRRTLDVVGGAAFDRASFSTPLLEKSGQFYWGDDYSQKIGKGTSLVQSYRMFNDLNSDHAYRVTFDLGSTTKLGKSITWNVSLSDRFQSDPAPGRKTNDWLYTTGFGVNFGK